MNRSLLKIMLSAAVLLSLAGTASAEMVKGRIKAIAGESNLFTLTVAQEKVLLISWADKTEWKGISSSADLKLDENLSVDFRLSGENTVATSIARVKTPLPPGIKIIPLDKLNTDSLTLVDTRAVELYDAGHIPGAISLPLSRLEKRTYGLLPENKEVKLVFYDEGQGGESAGKAAVISAKAGYTDIAILQEGASGWSDSGRFLASSTNFIRKSKPAVIDIRPQEQVVQGHIDKAANYPLSRINAQDDHLQMNKFRPVVIYGASDKDAATAAETITKMGYRRVTIYPGGASSWEKSAEVLETGPADELFSLTEANHGGELDPKDFESALASPVMVEIIDTRSAADHKKGGFPYAKQIPLQELATKVGLLNRDKIQVIFAADPNRAEMAYDYLKSKGFRLNYLNGSVEFEKDGKYKLKKN